MDKKNIAASDNGSYGQSCFVDNAGNLYITGTTQTNSSDFDSFTIKYENTVTSVRKSSNEIPNSFALKQNYPNPFNPSTKISYTIKNADFITLKIYDILGREIQALVDQVQKAGEYTVNFNPSNLSSGIYYYRLQKGSDFVETKKMLLLR